MKVVGPIGIFDSGYGGLTIFKEIVALLPQYDYLYLGDNARVPYGNRSFETIFDFTWECVQKMFDLGCPLVIIACNTASAKALRNIQQLELPKYPSFKKVLGVIRPTTELMGNLSQTREIGILATKGTVNSESYVMEINKFFPDIRVHQLACPMWVPLIENNEYNTEGGKYFIKKSLDELLAKSDKIDSIILACTHYPLLKTMIEEMLPDSIKVISQGEIVAQSLKKYLGMHTEVECLLGKNSERYFYTTDDTIDFNEKAKLFIGEEIKSIHLSL